MPSTPQRHAAANARSNLSRNPSTGSRRSGGTGGAGDDGRGRGAAVPPSAERDRRGRSSQVATAATSTTTGTRNTIHNISNHNNNHAAAEHQHNHHQQQQQHTPSRHSSRNTSGGHRGTTTPARERTASSRSTASNSSITPNNHNTSWMTVSPTSPTFSSSTRLHHHGTSATHSGGSSSSGGGGANGSAGPSPTFAPTTNTVTTTTPTPAERGSGGATSTTTSSSRRLRNPPGNPSPRASLRRGGTGGGSSSSMSSLTLSQSSLVDLSPGTAGGAAGGVVVVGAGNGAVGGSTGGGIGSSSLSVGGVSGSGPRTPGFPGSGSGHANRFGHPISQQSMRVIPSPIANSPAGWNETQFVPTTPGRLGLLASAGGGPGSSRTWQQYASPHHLTPGAIMVSAGPSGGGGGGGEGDNSIDSQGSTDITAFQNNIFASTSIDRDQLSIENMRSWRIDATHQHLYKTAAYWGDKVLSITDDPNDVFWLSQIYFDTGEYARAINLLQHQGLVHTSVACRFLATQCFIKMEKWSEALEILGEDNQFAAQANQDEGVIKLEASLCHLRGVVFKNLNNIQRAKECFVEALQIDIKCYEALDALVSNSMLTITEERQLIDSLDFNKQLVGQDASFVKMLYQSKLKKYDNIEAQNEIYQALEAKFKLENADLIYSRAEIYFVQSRFEQCLSCTRQILQRDKFNLDCMPMHLVCLYELDMKNDLFLLVHDLVDQHPHHAVAWFGVGVYYYLIGNMAEARRYFSKSSTVDSHYGPAWIGFGHSFAAEGEHDQAIAAYATSSKLLQGSHLGPMYIGMQHLQQNNTLLAQKYLTSCLLLCDKDPLLLNELGVMHYNLGEYDRAVEYFDKVVQMLELSQRKNVIWETTWLNLGHAHRKLGHYQEAETYYLKVDAVAMGGGGGGGGLGGGSGVGGGGLGGGGGSSSSDTKASALVALGFVYQIMGQLNDAIEAYHKVLAIRPSDQVASDMLQRVMEDKIRESEHEWFVSALPQELQTDESVHRLLAIREKSQRVKEKVLKRLHGRPLASDAADAAQTVPLPQRRQGTEVLEEEERLVREEEEEEDEYIDDDETEQSDMRAPKQPRIDRTGDDAEDDMGASP